MAITVQGTLRFPDNTPIVGASIKFVASKFIQSGVPIGASIIITTNSSGGYDQSILEGSYHIFIKQSGQELYTHLVDAHLADGIGNVSIGDPITLEEIIGTGPGDTPVYTGCSVIPAPTNFTVSGGFTTILLSWSIPTYICHAVTEIWVSTTDDFTNKALLTTTEASIYSHAIGHDATEYYWIRFRNLNGDYGNWYSATSVTGQTSQNPGEVLADLQQDVYNSTLFNALRTNINSSFYQETEPTLKANGDTLTSGDTWIKTSSSQRYVWDPSQVPAAWVAVTDKETLDALTRLTGTEAVADGEIRTFFENSATDISVTPAFGDIWIDISQPMPLTFSSVHRYEDINKGSSGTLIWRSASENALGLAHVQAYNTASELSNLQTDYTDFVGSVFTSKMTEIQNQIDGSVSTHFLSGVPTLNNAPADAWITLDTTNGNLNTQTAHIGDLYYDNGTGYAYRFIYEDLTEDGVVNLTFSWLRITDADVVLALANAAIAQDTADGKRKIFYAQPTIADADTVGGNWYDAGDIWILEANNAITGGYIGDIYRASTSNTTYLETDWVASTSYQAAIDASYLTITEDINTLNTTIRSVIDAKVNTYYQDDVPYADITVGQEAVSVNSGDLWSCTNTSGSYVAGSIYSFDETTIAGTPVTYTYAWTLTTAFSNSLFDLADGKRTIYSNLSNDAPTGVQNSDLWIPTTSTAAGDTAYTPNEIYQYSSATNAWVNSTKYTDDSALTNFIDNTLPGQLNSLQTQIDGKITTHFLAGAPTLITPPYTDWDTASLKEAHVGDLYYDTSNLKVYRFASDGASVPTYSWPVITDEGITRALTNASTAQDTADGKRRVFVSTPFPPYDIGDLWSDGATIKKCSTNKPGPDDTVTGYDVYAVSDWVLATTYITTYYADGNRVNDVWTTAPASPHTGDMWVVTDEADALYRYSGTAWILLSVATLANVDTKILEQKGICKITDSSAGTVGTYTYHATEALCEFEADGTTASGRTWEELGALASRTDTVSSTVGEHTSTITQQATSINGLESEYSVKLDNNGNVSGFGLSSGAPGCLVDGVLDASIVQADCTGTGKEWVTDSSTFLVAADTFAVAGTGADPVIPFVIRTGDANGTCYVDGVINAASTQALCEAIPGGSWAAPNTSVVGIQGSLVLDGTMSATTIKAGTITGDHIAGTTITGANIAAGAITANKITVTGTGAITPGTIGAGTIASVTTAQADASQALLDADNALAIADSQVQGFFQNLIPSAVGESFGDIWIDTDKATPVDSTCIYRYEDAAGGSTGTLAWALKPTSALGLAYLEILTNETAVLAAQSTADNIINGTTQLDLSEHNNATSGWTTDAALTTWIGGTYATDKLGLEGQIDGKSIAYFQDTIPYAIDSASDIAANTGDTWYKVTGGELKVFKWVTGTGTSSWDTITDPYIQGAYDDANAAQVTADGKIRNFTATPTTPYELGDVWHGGASGDINVCIVERLTGAYVAADWGVASKYTDDTTANGKITSFIQATTPTAEGEGDLWTDTTTWQQYRWDGTTWITLNILLPDGVATAINNNTTTILGSKITTGSLSALSADLGTVTAGKMESTDGKFVIDLTNKYISITV